MPERAYALKESAKDVVEVAVTVPPEGRELRLTSELQNGGAYVTEDVHEQEALDTVEALKTVSAEDAVVNEPKKLDDLTKPELVALGASQDPPIELSENDKKDDLVAALDDAGVTPEEG